ncbi:LOW QUALITY PROTEIN: A_thal_3526 domain-containing protein, partial [Cephalotus follicularis]
YYHHHHYLLPCLHCHPHSYIRMVKKLKLLQNTYCILLTYTHAYIAIHHTKLCIYTIFCYCLVYDYMYLLLIIVYGTKPQVQHLIERCLLLHMDQHQCIKALEEHAFIQPLITVTGSLCVYVCLCLVLTVLYMCGTVASFCLHIESQCLLAVWRELQKENREFFQSYFDATYPR